MTGVISASGRIPTFVAAYAQAAQETRLVMEERRRRGDHLIAQSQGERHAVPTAIPSIESQREIDIYA